MKLSGKNNNTLDALQQKFEAGYRAAKHFSGSNKIPSGGTGGSHWKKYMHPRFQKRIFFPDLWEREGLNNWGNE